MYAHSGQPQPRRRQLSAEATRLQEKLSTRSSRDELVTRRIIRERYAVICGQEVSNEKIGSWSWQRLMDDSVSIAASGLAFFVCITSNGDLVSVGMPDRSQFEAICAGAPSKKKTKALCHPPKSAHRGLLATEAAIFSQPNPTLQFPIKVNLLSSSTHSVRQVSCGLSHCVVLAANCEGQLGLHSWGIGDKGQLGLGSGHLIVTVMTPISASAELQKALTSSQDHASIFLRCGPVSSCVVISQPTCSRVWIWGSMPPHSGTWFKPTSDVIPSCDFAVRDVSLGLSHIVFVSRQGELFSWGTANDHGQLGIGLDQDHRHNLYDSLHRVPFHHAEIRFSQVCCGFSHTLVLSEDGNRVFAWGNNRLGACGTNTKFFDYFSPVLVPLRSLTISSIACCGHTSVAFLKSGTQGMPFAMAWGCVGGRVAHLLPTELDVPEYMRGETFGASAFYGGVLWLLDEDTIPSTESTQVDDARPANTQSQVYSQKQTDEPCLIGVSVVPSTQSSRLGDLRWTRIISGRLRVFESDIVVILLRQRTVNEFTIEPLETGTNANLTKPSVTPVVEGIGLHMIMLPMTSVGSFRLAWAAHDPVRVTGVLKIDCCRHPRMRNSILLRHRQFLRECYEEAGDKPIFGTFLQLVKKNHEIAEAIQSSPFASTKPDAYDIDRASYEMVVRVSRPRKRGFTTDFALWSDFLVLDDLHCNHEDVLTIPLERLELRDLLQIEEAVRLEMTFVAIANTVVPHGASFSVDNVTQAEESPVTTPTPSKLELMSLTVPQTALEFLVTGCRSRTELDHAHVLRDDASIVLGVCSWTNERRDRFYSVKQTAHAAATVTQIHLPDDISLDGRRSCLDQLTLSIHRFLWEQMDRDLLSISELYTRIGGAADALAFHLSLKNHGFQLRVEPSREEWYSVFRTILSQCRPKPVSRLTLDAFRLFMMDPFHAEFWRHYVADWCDVVQGQNARWRVGDALVQAFPYVRDKAGCIHWQEFVKGISKLHEALAWELSTATTCRLLYRLDRRNNGLVAVEGFFKLLIQEAMNTVTTTPKRIGRTRRAVASAWRRPDVEAFTTPDAVRKVFTDRARGSDDRNGDTAERDRLRRIGNSHLARVRSLPVTRLISEGVHFRPASPSSNEPRSCHADDAG